MSTRQTVKLFTVLILIACSSKSIVRAEFVFGEPTIVPELNGPQLDGSPQISRDGLEMYFISTRESLTSGSSLGRIWVSSRPTTKDSWSTPVELDMPANFAGSVQTPSLSGDGLELYFSDGVLNQPNPGGFGESDIWVMTRTDRNAPRGEPVNLGATINTEHPEDTPCISANGLELYYAVNVPNHPKNSELFMATRPNKTSPWSEPVNLGFNVNSDQYEFTPFISSDGLLLFFSRGYSKSHIWVSKRATTSDPWERAEFFSSVNSGSVKDVWGGSPGSAEYCLSFASGDSMFYFTRGTTAYADDYNIWQIEVTPIIDFNSDGTVDVMDISIMVDCWHTNEPLCDIAPGPMGDGFVDSQDLAVLSEYVSPPLIAHWALDESEGMIVANSSDKGNIYDGYIMGGAVWEPSGGLFDGALRLDGIDDYLINPTVVNPAKEHFSLFLWIQGGAPGQVVISEPLGPNWLSLDEGGRLITELTSLGTSGGPLASDTNISDGFWHHIGLVWDGSSRKLCVDGVIVAEDMQETLESPSNSLYIGTNGTSDDGTFFSGLIDDIRVFNRALTEKQIKGFVSAK